MAVCRRLHACFLRAEPPRPGEGSVLRLLFRPERTRAPIERIEDYADLGPDLTVGTVAGVGKVVRILRAARIAHPANPLELVGRPAQARALLERARGTSLLLGVRPRTQLRFVAWTESGIEVFENVSEVVEGPDAYTIRRRGGRFPVRVARDSVVRRRTEAERWFEVIEIERAPAA